MAHSRCRRGNREFVFAGDFVATTFALPVPALLCLMMTGIITKPTAVQSGAQTMPVLFKNVTRAGTRKKFQVEGVKYLQHQGAVILITTFLTGLGLVTASPGAWASAG